MNFGDFPHLCGFITTHLLLFFNGEMCHILPDSLKKNLHKYSNPSDRVYFRVYFLPIKERCQLEWYFNRLIDFSPEESILTFKFCIYVDPSDVFTRLGTRVCSVRRTRAPLWCPAFRRKGSRNTSMQGANMRENTRRLIKVRQHLALYTSWIKMAIYLTSLQRKSWKRGKALSALDVCFSSLQSLSAAALALGL